MLDVTFLHPSECRRHMLVVAGQPLPVDSDAPHLSPIGEEYVLYKNGAHASPYVTVFNLYS